MEGGGNIQEVDSDSMDDLQEYPSGCWHSVSHPSGRMHRFIALFFMSFLGFGSYFCYDNPAALMKYFHDDLNISTTQFTLLYSLYSWPNVVLCFVGGFLIDRVFGIRLGTSIYMFITLAGQVVFATGAIINTFWLMCLGRFLFGIGGESLAVAQNNYAVLWFKGKELNMVFGLQLSFARVGSAVNFWVMEPIYKWVEKDFQGYECLGIVLYISAVTCVLSMLCALILGCIDKRADNILRRSSNASGEMVRFSDVVNFPVTFWLISIICVAYYVAIFPFIAIAPKFFQQKFNLTIQEANFINSIVYLIAAFASPLSGLLVDKTGKNVLYVVLATICTLIAHLILTFCDLTPYVGMILLGLAYSMLASALWPMVALLVPEYQLGTAYGICQAVQNLGLAVISLLTGVIVDAGGYFWVEMFFVANLSIALLATTLLWTIDVYRRGCLNMTPFQREIFQQEALAAEILEREKLLSAGVSTSMDSNEFLQPNSDFHIRNRYLSRIGAPLPSNYCINAKGLTYRALR